MLRAVYTDAAGALSPKAIGVLGFDSPRPAALPADVPFACIEMPALACLQANDDRIENVLTGGRNCYEVWISDEARQIVADDDADMLASGHLLFGVLRPREPAPGGLQAVAYNLYQRLFDVLERVGDPTVLRIWNYIPSITAPEGNTERYRAFNQGRHDAFVARNQLVSRPPAASALGSDGGATELYFLASRTAGTPIENPRQVSAYAYPPQYGPRSPTFSRALLAEPGLFISGTASILGHRSMHDGDLAAQAEETFRNINTLLGEASARGFTPRPKEMALKVYVRHAHDLPKMQALVGKMFPHAGSIAYLRADICRPELLTEIEAMCPGGTQI